MAVKHFSCKIFLLMGLNLDFTIETPVCYGDSNGLIEVFVTGGSGDYSYEWFPICK